MDIEKLDDERKAEELRESKECSRKERIASPKVAGDLQVRRKLSDKHFLKVGFDTGRKEWFAQILNSGSLLMEWYCRKPVHQSKSVISDICDFCDINDICDNKKEAKKLLMTVLSDMMPDISDIMTEMTKHIGITENNNNKEKFVVNTENQGLIFDDSLQTAGLAPAVGVYKDLYYFGVVVPQRGVDTSQKTPKEVLKDALVFVTSDYNYFLVEERSDIKLRGNLMLESPRWSLREIENFTTLRQSFEVPDIKSLFEAIKKEYELEIFFNEDIYYDLHPLWDIGTYFFTLFNAYPYFDLWGYKRTAKTKVMTLSSHFAFNAILSVNTTPAVIYRTVDSTKPTLYLDEAENLWKEKDRGKDDTPEIVALLNSGWMNGSRVSRMEKSKDDKMIVHYFDAYCPKMFGSIKGIKGALADRCIRNVMVRASPDDKRGKKWMERKSEYIKIRNQLYPFALLNWGVVMYTYENLGMDDFKLSTRDWQVWKPLLALAMLVSDDLYQRVGKFAEDYCDSISAEAVNEEDWEHRLFQALFALGTDEEKGFSASDVKKKMLEYFGDNERKPSNQWVGKTLVKLGFKKFYKRVGSARLYYLTKKRIFSVLSVFHTAVTMRQYVTMSPENSEQPLDVVEEELVETSQTSLTSQIPTGKNDIKNQEKNVTNVINVTQKVYEKLSELQNQGNNIVPISDLIQSLNNQISEIEIENAIEQLKREGGIYEPKAGFVSKL